MQYLCSKCGLKASSTNRTDRIERFIGLEKKATTVSVRGLGTFRCPVHGKVSVRRTK
jgi:predicted RNA-binding Zn-ribbon protein involved in translation (DUF1610 family)